MKFSIVTILVIAVMILGMLPVSNVPFRLGKEMVAEWAIMFYIALVLIKKQVDEVIFAVDFDKDNIFSNGA